MAYWIEYFASLNPNQAMAWRTPLALQLVFIIFIGIGINFFPESPRWLMKMGRYEEARDILQATRSGDIELEARQIMQTVQYELKVSSANQYLAMIFPRDEYTRKLRWRVFLAVWLQIMQQLVGIGVVTVYAVDLFSTAGFSQNLSKLLAGFNNISYMFSVFFAVITLDRYGRRRMYYPANATFSISSTNSCRNHDLGRSSHGFNPFHRRHPGYVRTRSRTKSDKVRSRRRSHDLFLYCHIWRHMVDHALALPNRGLFLPSCFEVHLTYEILDFPTHRACQGRRMVCRRLVHWKWRGDNDHPFPLPGYRIRHASTTCRTEFLRYPIPFLALPGNGRSQFGADGCFL